MAYIPYAGKSTKEPSRFERTVRPARFSINSKHPLASGLVFAGLGNGQGYQCLDYSGQGNHGTLLNMEPSSDWTWSNELGRWVLNGDGTGSNEVVKIPSMANAPAYITYERTFAAWINVTSYGTSRVIFGQGMVNSATNWGWLVGINASGQLVVSYATPTTSPRTSTGTITAGQLIHIAVVNNAGGAGPTDFYINGVYDSGSTTSWAAYLTDADGAFFNHYYNASPSAYYFPGQIGDPLYWSRVLSAEEIKRLADPTNVMLDGLIVPDEPDRSITQKRVAIVRGVSFEKPKVRPEQFELDYDHPLAKGLVFAGLGQNPGSVRYNDSSANKNTGSLGVDNRHVRLHNRHAIAQVGATTSQLSSTGLSLATPATINLWFVNDYAGSSTGNFLATATSSWSINTYYSANTVRLTLNGKYGNVSTTNIATIASVPLHLSAAINASNVADIYVNGVYNQSITYYQPLMISTGALTIGALNCKIADVMCYSRILNNAEIQQLADPSNVMLSGLIKPKLGTTKYFRGVTLSDAYTLKPHVSHGVSRPENFSIDYSHPLAKGLVFAGLGQNPGSVRYNDSSPYGNHGTLTGMDPSTDWAWDSAINRYTLSLTGSSSEYVTHGNVALDTVYTLAMWANSPSNANSSLWSNGSNSYFLSMGATTYHLISSGTLIYWEWSGQSQTGQNHWALVRNGTTATLYKNGVSQGAKSPSSGSTNSTFYLSSIGKYGTQYMTTTGLADLVAYNRALSLPEIQILANRSNVLLSNLIKPIKGPIPVPINDRHWVGKHEDWHAAENWSRSQGGRGGAGVPNENTNVFFD
jgi:hypothetical protein